MTASPGWTPDQQAGVREALARWFSVNQRLLPWRLERSPYRTWVSEIMLQQTQVEAVRTYFERFLERFPSVQALAEASESEVLEHWAGLGYYSRARHLHTAARLMVERHGGEVPSNVEELLRLPGIGRYTAGAIASIAYNLPAPIVDGNVMRVLCRILELPGEPREGEANRRVWTAAAELVSGPEPGLINEALMELGARVCIPGMPRCPECPVDSWCMAFAHGTQLRFPERRPPPAPENRMHVALVIRKGENVLLERAARIWRGLWIFPTDFPESPGGLPPEAAVDSLAASLGLVQVPRTLLTTIRHGVMNWRITLRVFEMRLDDMKGVEEPAAMRQSGEAMEWIGIEELDRRAMPSPHRRIANLLQRDPTRLDF